MNKNVITKSENYFINPFNEDINNAYRVVYEHYNWSVVNNKTGETIVCFPNQIGAVNWIKNKNKQLN
jgi:hypothetical protein